jgi:hypothetical protein
VYDIQVRDKISGQKLNIRKDFKACLKFLKGVAEKAKSLGKAHKLQIQAVCDSYQSKSSIFVENHPDYLAEKQTRLETAFGALCAKPEVVRSRAFRDFFQIDERLGGGWGGLG